MAAFQKIILGVDPGTVITGYGLIGVTERNEMELIQLGILKLDQYEDHYDRLEKIHGRMQQIIKEYQPSELAIESPFYGKNIQVAIKIGRAQGIIMAAALEHKLKVYEYAPRKIKQSITGKGTASKEQVAWMLKSTLHFDEVPEFLDATDAVAVAVCHHYQQKVPQNKSKSWSGFLKENPDRIG